MRNPTVGCTTGPHSANGTSAVRGTSSWMPPSRSDGLARPAA